MSGAMRSLRAHIRSDLAAIAEIAEQLRRHPPPWHDQDEMIVVAYYVHHLYSAVESTMSQTAQHF